MLVNIRNNLQLESNLYELISEKNGSDTVFMANGWIVKLTQAFTSEA